MPKDLRQHVSPAVYAKMGSAMREAQAVGRWGPKPDFEDSVEFAAAWEYLTTYRGAGKTSAYGPYRQAMNDDANSHILRGFHVGWNMCKAMLQPAQEWTLGIQVLTVEGIVKNDWGLIANRRWGVSGTIVRMGERFGAPYAVVKYEDGDVGHFDLYELRVC